jgi:hypothetical protein
MKYRAFVAARSAFVVGERDLSTDAGCPFCTERPGPSLLLGEHRRDVTAGGISGADILRRRRVDGKVIVIHRPLLSFACRSCPEC